jgi:TPR repeat protein
MGVIVKLVSKLLLISFLVGLVSVYLPQKVLAGLTDEGITSFQIYESKANQGDADAQFNLAVLYHRGVGTPRDDIYAVYWYKKAAEQGHVNAQYSLGDLYRRGGGEKIPRDYKQAVYWLTKAAEQGCANAQYNLGDLYRCGGGEEVQRNYKQAFFWYTKAAEKGHYFAKEDRGKMLEKMSHSQNEEVKQLSKELYEKIDDKAK